LGKSAELNVARIGSSAFSSSDGASFDAQPAQDASAVRRISLSLINTSKLRIHLTGSIQYAHAIAISIDVLKAPIYNEPAMKMNGITRLEKLVRETVEGSFGRLFGGYLEPMDVATQLVQIMEYSTASDTLPNNYTVALHPTDYDLLLNQNPDLAPDLAEAAWKLGRRYGLPLSIRPEITIVKNNNIRRHSFEIAIEENAGAHAGVDTTQIIDAHPPAGQALANLRALDAFLIVQGKRHVPLDKPLITIGRRPDNDIVLDSKTVSRMHAQIRWRFDRFILYDVSNRGRTKVNGEAVSERILQQGDVIGLSDALLIYAEGRERDQIPRPEKIQDDYSDTQILPPAHK
jgi:hypothetical protein